MILRKYTAFLLLIAVLLLNGIAHATSIELPARLDRIETLQRRADALAFGTIGPDNYHLAKARTWLDLAISEYHENEQTGFVQDAIEQIESLLASLEEDQTGISMDTPKKLSGSEAVRPDLWAKIADLKTSANFVCGQRAIAEAEVHLVWAGHEKYESSWAHAQSYARSAEELLREAEAQIQTCALHQSPPRMEKITLSSDSLFEFGDANLDAAAQWRLNRLADHIRQAGESIREVVLIGHTDRLRSDGRQERNQILSEQRAESIRQYLIGRGISAGIIQSSGAGSSQPLVECSARLSREKQIACLKPNRRVEIILRGVK